MNSRFWRLAVLIFTAIVLFNYLPIFVGMVPFPRDLVVRHSAWNGQPQEQLPELIDIVAMFYPFRALLSRAADENTVPLWNPYIMSGAPFQANAQSAVFAPLNVVYYLLPLKVAWTLSLLLHSFLAAIFMAMFVRRISDTGAILSGILFGLCGFVTAWQGMSNGHSAIWLPLSFYAVHRLHERRDRRSIAIAAVAFAMPVLSGHPETAAHLAAAAIAFAAFLWFVGERRARSAFGIRFVSAALLALGLAAVQIIPTLEWMGQLGLQVEAPQPVLDRHQGQGIFSRDITRNPSSAGLWIPEAAAYVGMLGLLAIPLAFFHPSRRYVYFLLALAIASAVIAYGVQPVRWLIVHLPFIKAMKNGRLTLVMDFAFAALAGLGISAAVPKIGKRGVRWIAVGFVIVSFGIIEVHRATLTPVELSRSPAASLVFLPADNIVWPWTGVRSQYRQPAESFQSLVLLSAKRHTRREYHDEQDKEFSHRGLKCEVDYARLRQGTTEKARRSPGGPGYFRSRSRT